MVLNKWFKARKSILLVVILMCMRIGGSEAAMMNNHSLFEAQPFTYDVEMAEGLGLSDGKEFNAEYFAVQKYYADLLIEYLDYKIGLSEIDSQIANSDMRFFASEEPVNVYQEFFSGSMKYLFIRNNICVERLSMDELSQLKRFMAENATGESPDAMAFIESTFSVVLKGDLSQTDDTIIIYDRSGRKAGNCSVVLGLATDAEYDENDMFVSAAHEEEKDQYLKDMVPALEAKLSEQLQYSVTLFLYL